MRLAFNGSLTIARAETLQQELLSALSGNSEFVIDLSDADEIDVSFLQLLVATQRQALSKNTSVKIYSRNASMLAVAMERCGLASRVQSGIWIVPEIIGNLAS